MREPSRSFTSSPNRKSVFTDGLLDRKVEVIKEGGGFVVDIEFKCGVVWDKKCIVDRLAASIWPQRHEKHDLSRKNSLSKTVDPECVTRRGEDAGDGNEEYLQYTDLIGYNLKDFVGALIKVSAEKLYKFPKSEDTDQACLGGLFIYIYPNEPSIESLQLMFDPEEKEKIFGKWGF
ncbi:hypothetical protein HAX54_020216 [Datura stramonium]|uniref:Uncharacterized protein n=1 Tax=Datura stramonium TaxID=4076 RepID=A0ABS8UT21_DATST|nr:hypothetical protein [Datura stramonium]